MVALALTEVGRLEIIETGETQPVRQGYLRLKVLYCAICRTDAKMWRQGHRDLALPRVPGHELVGLDETTGRVYTVWPGQACGSCKYCSFGRENLCDSMEIIGFHSDGGFSDHVIVPVDTLVSLTASIPLHLFCFAEPVACVFNALSAADLQPGERVVIYGGGVVGLVAALVCQSLQASVVVVEQSQEKIAKTSQLAETAGISICKETTASDFDVAINCCDSPAAMSLCVSKLGKSGRLCFFSGLGKNEEMETNLLNLIHYRELQVYGSYGPRREHMVRAERFCRRFHQQLEMLVQERISPQEAPGVMDEVFNGRSLKYIIDFTGRAGTVLPEQVGQADASLAASLLTQDLPQKLQQIIQGVRPLSADFRAAAERKIDLKTKPLGALGRIEKLAVTLSTIQHSLRPVVEQKKLFVFAADHGVVEEGVSAFPAKVTGQMVENFLNGGAAINVFCKQYNIDLAVVDMGVNGDLAPHPLLIDRKVRRGTRNFAVEPAMSVRETLLAIEHGAEVFTAASAGKGCQLVGLGEMGIGNTSAAAAIISSVTGIAPREVSGRGTGLDDRALERKIEVLERALAYHRPDPTDGIAILSRVGGFEIAGICGAVLAAAANGSCIVLDGVISTAAGLVASLLCPTVTQYMVAGHKSVEIGQRVALEFMGLEPVVDLDMRLGEGTGAAITMNLVELAGRVMCDMATFEEAGVEEKL